MNQKTRKEYMKAKHKGILPREQWHWMLKKYAVKGVSVGGCVDGSPLKSHRAHAHTEGEHDGWICFNATGAPTDYNLIAHEVAHIICRQGHTRRFIEALQRIGAHDEAERICRRYPRLGRWLTPRPQPKGLMSDAAFLRSLNNLMRRHI